MARLTTVLICDHAQVRENLLMVMSGGVTRFHVPSVPANISFSVALVMEVPFFELEEPHSVKLTVVDPETAQPVAEPFVASFPGNPEAAKRVNLGEPVQIPLTVAIQLGVPRTGQFDIRVAVDDNSADIQSLWVIGPDQEPSGTT